ncbi:DUF3017 domain-containing protein [Streptomyces sp. RKND-216]|uniref:DUF3017 domain-containing protein n=1 Tax=Streptomyces sp. RKND-216 TaxID=2562581 RepID=UPI00109E002E|nr:DUF3017 domain-containing protein [Streptomyces sp. RKND-216]THA24883.1 DUF3017 domain-containing protein [Streptomyces sp. RKND-216]
MGTDDRTSASESAGEAPSATGPEPQRSRRFPVFTRDTARPEGGGRAAPGDAPAPARQWPMLAVATGVLVGLLVSLGSFRGGALTIGLTVLGAGLLRWWLPSVGMLAVRSRFTDVATYGVLGVGITLLAMMAQPDPWLNIPILDDIVHFVID